jgi:hypothetical protein
MPATNCFGLLPSANSASEIAFRIEFVHFKSVPALSTALASRSNFGERQATVSIKLKDR